MASTDLKRLRAMIDARRSTGGRVASGERAEIVAAFERAHDAGLSYRAIAGGAGLTLQTLTRWRLNRNRSPWPGLISSAAGARDAQLATNSCGSGA